MANNSPHAQVTPKDQLVQAAEREKFTSIFERIMEQRAELKSIQVAAQARRKSLVDESDRIE